MLAEQRVRALRREIEEQAIYHREQLGYLPAGKIVFQKNGSYVRWIHRDEDARRGGTVIHRKDRSFAEDLVLKNYHREMADVLEAQRRLLDQFLRDATSITAGSRIPLMSSVMTAEYVSAMTESILYANRRARNAGPTVSVPPEAESSDEKPTRWLAEMDLLTPILLESVKWMTDWCREAYECGDRRLNELRIRARCGLLVRSKSEAFIADWLFEHRIPFRYEQVLRVGDHVFCPDFTILLPDGRLIYWEHFGALGKSGYLLDTQKKLANYLEAGIYPGRDLLITCEDGDNPLDLREAEWILHMLCGKYMSSVPFGGALEVPLMMR